MKRKFDFATLAGLATWLLVYAISIYILQQITAQPNVVLVHLLFVSYGVVFWLLTREQGRFSLSSRWGLPLLAAQLAMAFGLLLLLPARYFDFLSILSIIWVGMLPFVMRTRYALIVVAIVVCAWFSIVAWQTGREVWITALLYGSFHIFAVMVQSSSRDAEQAKAELEQKHQQLQATQQLLQAASRQSERTRIARNLHDVVGHHLTALTIQLQVASHLSDGEVKTQVDNCHQLAKLLLADVREAVSTMREFADISLLDAIAPLLKLLPGQLQVRLDIAPDIMLRDLQQAQHLLCIMQEALSNSLKHSGASEVTISAALENGELKLTIYDNGRVTENWRAGNGITGMRERLAECGGNILFGIKQQALLLTIALPYSESDSA